LSRFAEPRAEVPPYQDPVRRFIATGGGEKAREEMLAAIRGDDIFKNAPSSDPALVSQADAPEEPNIQHRLRTQALIAAFGDEPTFCAVLQLTVKIVEPASIEKAETVLRWFASNFRNLKERMRRPQRRAELRRRLQAFPRGSRDVLGVLDNCQALSRLVDAARADLRPSEVEDIAACTRLVPLLRRVLETLAPHAATAAAKVPTGKGSLRDDADISAEELCAFMLRQAWQAGRG
jgi:hypothetical protein